ncbi:MAG TPA: hypothetical protein VGF55_06705 [Gemmataceae bacterium]|jgi:hypothetical protein
MAGRKWGVLVIHGVGATDPGMTVDALVPPLLDVQPTLVPTAGYGPCVLRLPDAPLPPDRPPPAFQPPDPIETFPVHVRHLESRPASGGAAEPVTVAEVFWADLATVAPGRLALLWGLFQAIFSLGHVADQAARQPGAVARWFRFALWLTAQTLYGPVAALNAVVATGLLAHIILRRLSPAADGAPAVAAWLAVLLTVAGAILYLRSRAKGWGQAWQTFWLFYALTMPAAWLVDATGLVPATYLPPADAPADVRSIAVVLFLVRWVYLPVVVLLVADFGLWLAARTAGPVRRRPALRPGLDAALAAILLQIGLWLLLTPATLLVVRGLAPRTRAAPDGVDVLLRGSYLAFLFHLGLTAVFGLSVLAVYGRRARWSRRQQWATPIPRLIVNAMILATLLALSLVSAVTFAAFALGEWGWSAWCKQLADWLGAGVGTLTGNADAAHMQLVATAAAGLLAVAATPIRDAVHILMDVINHFYRPHCRVPWPVGPVEGNRITDFTVQVRIEDRCERVLRYLRSLDVTHLAVVAHSQGTVIAVDVLAKRQNQRLFKGLADLRLVTMGSPLTHLYQHYFPKRYPPLWERCWRLLFYRVRTWVNVYRRDDFVGMDIDFPAVPPPWWDAKQPFPYRNVPLGPGGHTGYWMQRAALAAIGGELP